MTDTDALIRTKTELLEILRADRSLRVFGHQGARPSSPWKYEVHAEGVSYGRRVSSATVNACKNELREIRGSWMYTVRRLKHVYL